MELAIFAALADPPRRAVVSRLAYGPATAGQLAELAAMSRPAVSQHIRVLCEAGVIRGAREGKFIWYELDGAPLAQPSHCQTDLPDPGAPPPPQRVTVTVPVSYLEL